MPTYARYRIVFRPLHLTVSLGLYIAYVLRAQIPVEHFGAVGDGRHDDTAALQSAIDGVPEGSDLLFGGARNVYLIRATLVLRPHRTYTGAGTIRMSSDAPSHTAMIRLPYSAAYSVTIRGLTLDAGHVGGAIQIAVGGANSLPGSNITIQNTVIRNTASSPAGPWDGAIYDPVGLINSSIDGNQIDDCPYAISLYNPNHVAISGNRFLNISIGNAIGVTFKAAAFEYGQAIRISNNKAQGLGRMAIEFWPTGGNVAQTSQVGEIEIDHNIFSGFHPAPGADGFGISVMAGDHNVIHDNELSGSTAGFGIELGAANSQITRNTIHGFATGIVLHDAHGSRIDGNLLDLQAYTGIEFSNAPGSRQHVMVENNRIVDPRAFGIFSNTPNTGGSKIAGNQISRGAGRFETDPTQSFTGISITPPDSPIEVAENVIRQTAAATVSGFRFTGIRVNGAGGSNRGSIYRGNTVESAAASAEILGFYGNSDGSLDGAHVAGNRLVNLGGASGGAPSAETVIEGNTFDRCLARGPLFESARGF